MRIYPILSLLVLTTFTTCKQERHSHGKTPSGPGLEVITQANPELEYENLRLYPITAAAAFIDKHAAAAGYHNLAEAIDNHRFRITEKKPFGRFEDLGAVNTLTVQNKTENVVFLMAGDVVQGGKQDRVIAQDLVVPPRTITDIAVFCVEPHRWQARSEHPGQAEDDPRQAGQNKRIYAFTGYYNVAAGDIRRSAARSRDQQEVWDKVGEVTAIHNAQTSTGTYAALEQSESFTQNRSRYLAFFGNKFDEAVNTVGIVAVSGNEVIGADIFAHPELFRKQYKALIHSYITDAITNGRKVELDEEDIQGYAQKLLRKFTTEKGIEDSRYEYQGLMVHFADL